MAGAATEPDKNVAAKSINFAREEIGYLLARIILKISGRIDLDIIG
jgi:hypothetical protein